MDRHYLIIIKSDIIPPMSNQIPVVNKKRKSFFRGLLILAIIMPAYLSGCTLSENLSGQFSWQSGVILLLLAVIVFITILLARIRTAENRLRKQFEAVVNNYKGIIWNIDKNRVITIIDGQSLKKLWDKSKILEGKNISNAHKLVSESNIVEYVEKTFKEGPQEWISEISDSVYHTCTTPVYGADGNIEGIVGGTDNVTERIKLQNDLSAAVETAKAASESKSRFLASMSHEMRTPLNAIIGLSELELGNAFLEGDSFANMEKIYSAGINLLGIINDLLDISKIEAGKFVLVPMEYDVSSMINDTLNLNIVRIGSKPIQFHLHVSGSLPAKMEGDELRVKQIFNNLLSNAIKYTVSGYVDWTISCITEKDRIKVISTVRDTGIGIHKEDQERLFSEDYYKTDLKANYYMEGTGLGLPITLNLIKLMNGTISLQSEYRMGSAFTVEFCQGKVTDEEIGDEAADNLSQFRYSAHRRNKNQKLLRANMSYASVLVVDDVVANLEVARGMLKPYKLHVECVTSGIEAVKRIREDKFHYDAIFMDHMMPDMDGLEAVQLIRNDIDSEYAKSVPIIALTANAMQGSDSMFLEHGFQAFISKPIDILRLDQLLNQWVRNREKEKDLPVQEEGENGEKIMFFTKSLHIPGLNVRNGLARFENDEESYLRVLRAYVNHTGNFINTAKNAGSDLDVYRIAVHSIKGSGRGIGAEKLGDMAERLETAAKQSDTLFIKANNAQFIEAAEKLIAGLSAFLKTIPDDTDDVVRTEQETLEPELLAALKKAAEDYDITALYHSIETLDAFTYRSQPGLAKWLKEKAGTSDFIAIQKRLESI